MVGVLIESATYGSFTLHQLLHLEQSSGGGLADVETAISAYDAIALAHGNAVSPTTCQSLPSASPLSGSVRCFCVSLRII